MPAPRRCSPEARCTNNIRLKRRSEGRGDRESVGCPQQNRNRHNLLLLSDLDSRPRLGSCPILLVL